MTPTEAELYAHVHDGTPGDATFYRAATRGASRVLELGCGWGRIASQLAGPEVLGLESDPGMRALAARRNPALRVVPGDMRSFALGTFDRVIVPFTGIYCLLTETDLASCLRCVRESLTPTGRFVFDAYAADAFHAEARPEDYPAGRVELVACIEQGAEPLDVFEYSRWDRDAQRMDATYVYVAENGETRAELTIGHRYLLRGQLEGLFADARLRLVSVDGSFDGAPYDGTEWLVVVGARA